MRNLILASALFLAACGQQATELPEPPAAEEAAPVAPQAAAPTEQAMSTGEMGAMSTTAMSITGSLTVTPAALQFEKGFAAQTEYLGVVDATTPIAQGGQSFAATTPGPVSLRIEVRRIAGQAPGQLCGPGVAPTYVALASDTPLTALTVLVFSGPEAPGPSARNSALCATYAYAVD